jgi:hypothetical protein
MGISTAVANTHLTTLRVLLNLDRDIGCLVRAILTFFVQPSFFVELNKPSMPVSNALCTR